MASFPALRHVSARVAPRWAAIALGVMVFAGCFLDPTLKQEEIRREAFNAYTEGLDLEKRGEYTQALDLYLKAIKESPRAAFYYHAGLCHARLGHDDRALEFLDRALEMEPDYELARAERDLVLQRADLKAEGKRPSREEASIPRDESTTSTAPAGSMVSQLAGLLPSAKKPAPKEGLPTAAEVRKIVFPDLVSPTPSPAPGETAETEPPAAIQGFHFPPTEDDQARLASEAGRLEQAAFYLDEEVKTRPQDPDLRLRLARVLARSGRISRAESELREAARLAPNSPDVWYEWGGFYVRQEDWVEAERCYRECLRLDPNHIRARNNLGVALLKLSLWERAYEQFRVLIRDHPDFASPYLNLAIIEAEYRGDIDQAVAFAEDYVRYDGARSAEVRRWRQDLLLRKGSLPTPVTP